MIIAIPKETESWETRTPLLPESVKKLKSSAEVTIRIEKGLAEHLGITDTEYSEAGAEIIADRKKLLADADIVLRINKPELTEIKFLKKNSIHISFLDPFNEKKLIEEFASNNISSISMEMIPRTTLAQKMDALSSQASLAGYAAVIESARVIQKAFPMMMTPAGTISPVKVFIIGAGVAGLQAIATAKRLGARVEAYDTREVVEDQVKSLGAKFIKFDIGETGQTKDGYAKALTEEQLQLQRKLMKERCVASDVVITTAKLFGRKAPLIIPGSTIKEMKPGSVVVDLAVETGGNVEGSKAGETVVKNGVSIIGIRNLPGTVAVHSSQMYGSNLANLLIQFWNKEQNQFELKHEDEIIKGCLITDDGKIINETILKHYQKG